MPLQPGTTLGSYSVTAKIGEGGMGEVYRARDTTLDRDVAIKAADRGRPGTGGLPLPSSHRADAGLCERHAECGPDPDGQ